MKIGITELVLPSLPIPDFFRQISKAGYESAELAVRNVPNAPLNYTTSDAEIRAFKQTALDYRISIDDICISCRTGNLLLPPSEAKDTIEETAWALECAHKLGATAALHTLGRPTPELFYEDAYKNAVANLKTLAPICKKLGVAIAVEFIWSGFLFSPVEVRNFLNDVNCPDEIGFYFDTGNMAIFQYPQHWARTLGPYIKRVHLKDFHGGPGRACTWPGLLKGDVNFPAVMAELRKAGYDGPMTSEVSIDSATLEQTAQAIRQIIAM